MRLAIYSVFFSKFNIYIRYYKNIKHRRWFITGVLYDYLKK